MRYLKLLVILCLLWIFPVYADEPAGIDACKIMGGSIVIDVSGTYDGQTDDQMYYLVESRCYGGKKGNVVTSRQISDAVSFTVPLRLNTPESRLCSKFTICVKKDGTFLPISSSYITNPEALAKHSVPRFWNNKKGILISAEMLDHTEYLTDLGIEQGIYNVMLGDLFGGGTGQYEYNGKIYLYDEAVAGQYDKVMKTMEELGIQMTMVILNNKAGDQILIHPDARGGNANYYAFNTADKEGAERLEAAASFLANRYSGGKYGTVDNWIIGNEINADRTWHYIDPGVNYEDAVQIYADAFRIFYNSILSVNANAHVYTSIDNQWTSATAPYHPGKEFLELFNKKIKNEGNIFWNAAVHPYNSTIGDNKAWKQVEKASVTHDENTDYITMQNIDVFLNFMRSREIRNSDLTSRSIICSEQGYTSIGTDGETNQAASILYAYYRANGEPLIDGFLLSRQQDSPDEVQNGLALGLMDASWNKKKSYEWYKNADNMMGEVEKIVGSDLESTWK